MRFKWAMTGCLILTVLLGVYFLVSKSEQEAGQVNLWGYQLERISGDKDIQFLLYQEGSEKLEITVINGVKKRAAESLIDEKIHVFGSLFEKQRVGYSGQHTEFVSCPDNLKPSYREVPVTGGQLKYFSGYANSRYAVGVCLEEDVAFISLNAYLYCNQSAVVYDISYFNAVSLSKIADDFVRRLICEDS